MKTDAVRVFVNETFCVVSERRNIIFLTAKIERSIDFWFVLKQQLMNSTCLFDECCDI